MRGTIKLVEFDSYGGVQQTELRDNFLSRFRRVSYISKGGKKSAKSRLRVRKVETSF